MKTHLSFEDLTPLTDYQKTSLRSLWRPAPNDLAGMIIWKDVENDEYALKLSLVQDARVRQWGHDCDIQLKLLLLDNDAPEEEPDQDDETEEMDSAGEEDDTANGDDETESDSDEDAPNFTKMNDYLSIEFCLPLLNIGQMIGILKQNNPNNRFNIDLEGAEAIVAIGGDEFSGEELCDVLWEALKSSL